MTRLFLIAFVFSLFFIASSGAQKLDGSIPIDSSIIIGRLGNGLTYYIKRNLKPERRAEIYLAVKVGSVLEDDNQRGIAHFIEHMAFNGTEHFKKNGVVNYLESIGMRFGPDINAYTGFDETVYMLQVPTDSIQHLGKACQILADWASSITFDSVEVEKERGVVIEEWRLGRGANARMSDKQFPVIMHGSKYANRLAIGKRETIESFQPKSISEFYKKWYRPELMAVIAVGDFETDTILSVVKNQFSSLPRSTNQIHLPVFPVPDHEDVLVSIATDPEATHNTLAVFFKNDPLPEMTNGDYRRSIVQSLFTSMLNQRYQEISRRADAPFLYASAQDVQFVRTKNLHYFAASVRENQILPGFNALLTEAERVRRHGFTPEELDREKKSLLRAMERAYAERDKSGSGQFAEEYVRNFLEQEPIPGIRYEYMLYQEYIPEITLNDANIFAQNWLTPRNVVITASGPEKDGVSMPSADTLKTIFSSVTNSEITKYQETTVEGKLLDVLPEAGTIVSRSTIDTLNVTEWALSNGVRVILKPTPFKNDQILLSAFSPGGSSIVADSDYIPAMTAVSLLRESGAGKFDRTSLERALAGKAVSVSPYIGELAEGFSGTTSPEDLETFFQLLFLYSTQPRWDSNAFESYRLRMTGMLENRNARPESAFLDTIDVTLSQHHFRRRPWSTTMLNEMNLSRSAMVYRNRFGDFGDFTFVFVGSFNIDTLEPLVIQYLGGLPSTMRIESWQDINVRPPTGVVHKEVRQGIEPKSQARITFTGPFDYKYEHRVELQALVDVLRIKMRESLREEKSGTYGVSVAGYPASRPVPSYSISVSFGSAPERMDELVHQAFAVLDSVKTFGPDPENLSHVKEIQKKGRETDMQENQFWLRGIEGYYQENEDPLMLLRFQSEVESLTPSRIQKAASQYLNFKNYVEVVLYPKDYQR